MKHFNYTPLSAQDMDFLDWETPSLQMHGSAVQIFTAGRLANDHGGIDFERIKRGYASVLHRLPRYRQKLAWIPGRRQAVWIDDPHFNLDYHLRHTALPRPGTENQLKRLAARIMEHPLDRARPLWEVWVAEGLEGARFAMISKTHHCILDGTSGADLLELVLSRDPDWDEIPDAPRYVPRPVPSAVALRDEARREWIGAAWGLARELRQFLRETPDPLREVALRVRSLGSMTQWKLRPASETPLNGPVGPHRVFEWLPMALDDVKAVRKARGSSVNDVVLAIVTGALREFLTVRGLRPATLDLRASTPVNVRTEKDRGTFGNRVSAWTLRLPVDRTDPLEALEDIQRSTQRLKESRQAAGVELLMALHEWLPIDLQSMQRGTINLFVTNVPGAQYPVYLLGSKLLALFPQAPLIQNLGLVIAVWSYDGKLCWGFNADYDRVPDLADFAAMVQRSFERLAIAAGVAIGPTPTLA